MFQENEVITFFLGLSVLGFIISNRASFNALPEARIICMGFYVLFMGWVLTIAEEFFAKNLFNYLEHMCYATSSILIAVWCWKMVNKKGIEG